MYNKKKSGKWNKTNLSTKNYNPQTQYMVICVMHLSLNILLLKFLHIVACISSLFLFMALLHYTEVL